YMITLTVLALVIAALVARSVIIARARRQASRRAAPVIDAAAQLAQARALAAQGAYVDAAHLLQAAIVTRLVEHRRVRQHPSKTVGDYWRELRNAGDALAPAYHGFARVYDIVAYGDGLGDATRWAHLEQLAAPVLEAPPRTTAARAA
ncbi:MAG TPA: DUF4129 domain-containing protein, partial [Gemmatimonadaceae bacterium]|nr:DUF4129 domain-containing protein [Gemmatimonadaceae bacterium]